MKTVTIHGIPYQIDDKNNVYMYESLPPISLGTWDPEKQKLTLVNDWKTKSKSFVEKYRSNLQQNTEELLEKAKQLQSI